MARQSQRPEAPACYALVIPGIESITADEITRDLAGTVKRAEQGVVVFRPKEVTSAVLRLRTAEDVFLLAWGSNDLTYRAEDLERIRHWTARQADWEQLLRIHHLVRPKPKGKPSFRLVTQMIGEHGYRRKDAREALARGLAGKLPPSWRHTEDNAAVEIWLTIDGATAVCGLRLSDRTMRHRSYKIDHLPASLRPTLAAAMVRLAGAGPHQVVIDPMCGAGTILAEQVERARQSKISSVAVWGGDHEQAAIRAATANLRRLGLESRPVANSGPESAETELASSGMEQGTCPITPPPLFLARWDAGRLPIPDHSVDRLLSNPPFGKQLSRPEEVGALYRRVLPEYDRVLRPEGRAVLLVSDAAALKQATALVGWSRVRQFQVRILGQRAVLSVWRKGG